VNLVRLWIFIFWLRRNHWQSCCWSFCQHQWKAGYAYANSKKNKCKTQLQFFSTSLSCYLWLIAVWFWINSILQRYLLSFNSVFTY